MEIHHEIGRSARGLGLRGGEPRARGAPGGHRAAGRNLGRGTGGAGERDAEKPRDFFGATGMVNDDNGITVIWYNIVMNIVFNNDN